MQPGDKALLFWGSAIGGLIAADYYCDTRKDETTLSCGIRRVLRVEQPLGEASFVGLVALLNVWFVPHIIRPARIKRRLLSLST